MSKVYGHDVRGAFDDGAEHVIMCDCGVESFGRTWEEAGRKRDAHLEEEKRAEKGGGA